jgi:hypothetical protein
LSFGYNGNGQNVHQANCGLLDYDVQVNEYEKRGRKKMITETALASFITALFFGR